MTSPETATALAEAARELHAAARTHKRSEFQHRRQARDLMRKLDELRTVCNQLGIHLDLDTDPHKEGGHSHG